MDGDLLLLFWWFGIPVLFAATVAFILVFWFLYVPKPAKVLIAARRKQAPILLISDDAGWADLCLGTKTLPEAGVYVPKYGWRFFPQKSRRAKTGEEALIERVATKKNILRGVGVPIYVSYAGKAVAVNPALLAAVEGSISKDLKIKKGEDPEGWWKRVQGSVARLVHVNPGTIMEVLGDLFPSSAVEAMAIKSEMIGMQRAGRDYAKLALSGGIILAILILGIVALSYIFR